MSPPARTYKLDELAAAAGVSIRTIRYYVQRELLPAPQFRGPDTAYSERHLLQLQAIRALQARQWSLDAIAAALSNCQDYTEIEQLALGAGEPAEGLPRAPVEAPQKRAEPSVRPVEAWNRISLGEGVEIWLRSDVSLQQRWRQDRILAAANRAALEEP